jgi:hypothetical protein
MNELVGAMIDITKAASICGLDVETMRQWTDSGHAPHYTINGNGPYYKTSELREWAKTNLIVRKGGFPIPSTLNVLRPVHHLGDERIPPMSLSAINGLCHIPIHASFSGIYFLCHGDDVVYVGQSTCIFQRIGQHVAEEKKQFDHHRVFVLPCPVASLDLVEQHFIETIRPKYNGGLTKPGLQKEINRICKQEPSIERNKQLEKLLSDSGASDDYKNRFFKELSMKDLYR